MRYWIWWNDLIQGPFEPDELSSLKAFSEDLLVCMEDRQDWLPASRVADLSAAVEQLRTRQAPPRVPPPPPPQRAPSVTPLQGEFFPDPPGQEHLLDPEEGPKGPFAYYPVSGDSEHPHGTYLRGEATMPFHFIHQPAAVSSVIEMPRPTPARIMMMTAPPVIRESPVPKPVEKVPIPLSVLETISKPAKPPAMAEIAASRAPAFEEFPRAERKPPLLLWILGVLFACAAVGTFSFWLVHRASPRSANSTVPSMSPSVETIVASPPGPTTPTAGQASSGQDLTPIASGAPLKETPVESNSGRGISGGSPSAFSSLSSALRQLFSRQVSPQKASVAASGGALSGGSSEEVPEQAVAGGVSRSPATLAGVVTGAARGTVTGAVAAAGSAPVSTPIPVPTKSLTADVKNVPMESSGAGPPFASPPIAASSIPSAVTGKGAAGLVSVLSSLSSALRQVFSGPVSPQTARETQTANSVSPTYTSVVTGASLGAKSGIGIAGGSAFALSSISSLARRAFSPRGSAPTASEMKAVRNNFSKQSSTAEIAASDPYGQPLQLEGAEGPPGGSAAAMTGAPSGAMPGIATHGPTGVLPSLTDQNSSGLGSSQTASETQTTHSISSKQSLSRQVSADVPHRQTLNHKQPRRPKSVEARTKTFIKKPPQPSSAKASQATLAAAAPVAALGAAPGQEAAMDQEGPPLRPPEAGASQGISAAAAANPVRRAMPGVGTDGGSASALSSPAGKTVPERVAPEVAAPAPAPIPKPDPWKGKQNEAIALVQNKTLPKSKITVGNQARAMLQQMHEKELIHAAETGERLYLPDKIAWTALQEEGSIYRVYLNFFAWQPSGERVQSRSYQFVVDVNHRDVRTDDVTAQQDLLTQPAELTFKHNPMATDIDSILGGVDTFHKHQVQLIIVKKNRRNREERKKIDAALETAQGKITRSAAYFQRTYPGKALENVAKAYDFSELLKG